MAQLSPAAQTARGKIRALSRYRQPDDPDLVEARRNLLVEKLAAHVAEVVAAAPELSESQCERITSLLRNGGAAHD